MKLNSFEEGQIIRRNLVEKYEEHFNISFPTRIVGWGEYYEVNATMGDDFALKEEGKTLGRMKKDIDKAIKNNEPIEEIPEELWKTMIF